MAKITFKEFYGAMTKDELVSLAEKANTSTAYLYQIANGIRKPGIVVITKLKAADHRITDAMLRPDLYA
jgi:hypothetical protein